ncbi:DotA/TraY family protein [Piscirickettsia litoralis]|uniref:Type IV secretion protein DotA n=1 Tax=Piscirickettsia litoralis TaxID=1891921 RepID=A0ABX3A8M8_9GAMM|nr:DotA/TraY family protein [Piscirickettsia litoralis]ODN42479.1 hypothetical protein BGC07_05480 [Piscirickettsia litoralis]
MNNNLEIVKDELDKKLSYPGMSISSTINYDVPMYMQIYPLINGSPVFYEDTSGNAQDASEESSITDAEKLGHTAAIPSQTNTIPDGLNLFANNNWQTLVAQAVYGSGSECTGEASDSCDPQNTLYANLINLPDDFQVPFDYLFNLLSSDNNDSLAAHSDDITFLNNVFSFLSSNGVYQTTSTTSIPVYAVVDKIFGNLTGNGLSSDVTGVMNEFYQLGMPSTNLFSTIMQAQQTGADVVQMVLDSFTNILDTYQKQFQNIQDTAESMVKTTSVVSGVTAGIGALFGSSALSSVSATAATLGQTLVQLYMASQIGQLSISLAWLPLAMMVLGSLFTAAITFIVMMPLIPYFLFWAGTIVWVLSILEGLIASPLVALALVYPEGHEVLGHGAAGVKIALNIIFRPVLMVIGVTSAMALTYVLITYSAQGFHLVGSLLLNNFSSSTIVKGIVSCFLIFIYSSFMMMAFNKCFSVIYLIPDKVLDWIGISSSHRAGAEEVQQLQGKTESMAGQSNQAMSSGAEKGIQAQQKETSDTVTADMGMIQVAEKGGAAGGGALREGIDAGTGGGGEAEGG